MARRNVCKSTKKCDIIEIKGDSEMMKVNVIRPCLKFVQDELMSITVSVDDVVTIEHTDEDIAEKLLTGRIVDFNFTYVTLDCSEAYRAQQPTKVYLKEIKEIILKNEGK